MAWSTTAQVMVDLIKALKGAAVSQPRRRDIYALMIASFIDNDLEDASLDKLATCVGLDEAFDDAYGERLVGKPSRGAGAEASRDL